MTNWYIRFNRKRLKGTAGLGAEDTAAAMNTLLEALFTIIRAMAPFIPFLTEHIYGLLKPHLGPAIAQFADSRSVHFLPYPTEQEALLDEDIERKVSAMQNVIRLARTARERANVPLKTPLLSLVVIADSRVLSDVGSLSSYIKEELNVREVTISSDEEQFNILLQARVDWPTLGKKLKKEVQKVRKALPDLSQEQLRQYLRNKRIDVAGIQLEENDLTIVRVLGTNDAGSSDGRKWEPAFEEDVIVLLDVSSHPELQEEGFAREMINRVQRLRKKAGLVPTDDVLMQYTVLSNPENINISSVVSSQDSLFTTALRGKLEETIARGPEDAVILEEEQVIGNLNLLLRVAKI